MEPKTNLKPLFLKTDLGDSFFDYEEVIRSEVDGRHTIAYLIKDKQVRCFINMKDLNPILPKSILEVSTVGLNRHQPAMRVHNVTQSFFKLF